MKLLRDTWLIFARNVVATLREPVWVVIGLFQPVCFLVLFAPLLNGLEGTPGFPPGDALDVFTPGLLVLMGLYGAAFVGFGLIPDLRDGLIERLRVTPVSRLALLLGRTLRDVLILLVQSLLLVAIAWPFGLGVDPLGLVLVLGMLVLLGLIMASCSYALALALKSEDALASLLNTVAVPMTLLSGIYLPLALAPDWLQTIAGVNPLAYAVNAARALMGGDFGDASVLYGFAVLAPLAVLALWWAARAFRKATA
jgi:ABC-2 type transport system permease protein